MIRLDKIVTHLRTNANIVAIAPGGIFSRFQSKKTSSYIILSLVSDVSNIVSDSNDVRIKTGRVEFRFIWWTKNTSTTELFDMIEVVDGEILSNPCNPISDYDWFNVINVVEWLSWWIVLDSLWIPVVVKDYRFTYFW